MSQPMRKTKLASILLVCFLFSGCSLSDFGDSLKKIDQKIGEGLKKFQEDKIDSVLNSFDDAQDNATSTTEVDIDDLTLEQKEKIDSWLEENNLNRYGDPIGTFYTGGTPLFDEKTGLSIGRYSYILENHPELIDFLKQK